MCSTPPVDWFRERYSYDVETGALRRTGDGKVVEDNLRGYLRIRVRHNGSMVQVAAHRVAWALVHGEWPANQIDHINGNRGDNRLCNLREVTHEQNQWNREGHADRKKSPYPGVQKLQNGKWRGMIMVSGERRHLGVFESPDEAYMAYQAACRNYRGQYSRI